MKKVLLLAALTMVAANAHASKARLAALQNAAHLVDVQNDFDQPWQASVEGELATVEMGSSTAGSTTNAEGGFLRAMGDGYLGAYLGHQPSEINMISEFVGFSSSTSGANVTAADAFSISNPVNIIYAAKMGDINWGVNLYWENSSGSADSGTNFTQRSSNVSGVSLGASNGVWDADAVIGLVGKGSTTTSNGNTSLFTTNAAATTTTALTSGQQVDFKSDTTASLRGGWKMDNMYYYATYGMGGAQFSVDQTEVADAKVTSYSIGAINSHKHDGVDFFYGLSFVDVSEKTDLTQSSTSTQIASMNLPLIVGVEAEANSWIVLRGSITQSFLLDSVKSTNADGSYSSGGSNNTTVAAGAGFKFNKFTLDTFIYASNTGTISLASDGTGTTSTTSGDTNGTGDKFLTQASLTYMF